MKKSLLINLAIIIAVAAFSSTAVSAKPVTKEERAAAVKYLKHTQKLFRDAVKGLSEEQLMWKPAPDKWSVFEVSSHIALAEVFLFDLINGAVMKAPANATKTSSVSIELIQSKVPDRTQKFPAPEPIQPDKARWTTMEAAMDEFKRRRENTINFVAKGNDDMRERFMMNPAFNAELDAYQWIIFLSAHTERHVKQILEVKANANFPKKKGGY